MTLAQVHNELAPLDTWLAGHLTANTRRAYLADATQFLGREPTLAACQAVTFDQVIAWRNGLASRGYARNTINRKLSAVRGFFRLLVAAGVLERNPADPAMVKGYKQEQHVGGKVISTPAVESIVAAANASPGLKGARDGAILALLLYGGLRRSEAARARWEDLRSEAGYTVLAIPDTKSGMPQEVKLQAPVIAALQAYREALAHAGREATGPMFLSLAKNATRWAPMSGAAVNEVVKQYARNAGAGHVTAHQFRHTCCTLAMEGGAKPQQVQAHLRHKDIKTTMRYYEQRDKLADNAGDYIRLTDGGKE